MGDNNNNIATVSLEIVGKEDFNKVDLQRIVKLEQHHVKLRLFLPQQLNDNSYISNGIKLISNEIQKIGSNNNNDDDDTITTVEGVKISNIKFEVDNNVTELLLYLSSIASSVKYLTMTKLITGSSNRTNNNNDDQIMARLLMAFSSSQLVSLNLSNNILGSYVWEKFSNQTRLNSIILEDVVIDDDSLSTLSQLFTRKTYTESLQNLCYSSTRSPTTTSRNVNNNGSNNNDAENSILEQCTNLRSLRWVNKTSKKQGTTTTRSSRFPYHGFLDMANTMFRMKGHLHHLEIEGSTFTDDEFSTGLCEGLKVLFRLNVLKLRKLEISNIRVQMLVNALKAGRLPLQKLDLSRNPMGDDGAELLSQLLNDGFLMMNLKHLSLEYNNIGNKGGIAIFSAMGNNKNITNIRINGNPMQMTKVTLGIAELKSRLEKQCDKHIVALKARLEKPGGRNSPTSVASKRSKSSNSIKVIKVNNNQKSKSELLLQGQVEKLLKERETLISAFSIMGVAAQVREQQSILERLSRLEEAAIDQRNEERSEEYRKRPKGAIERKPMQRTQSGSSEAARMTWEMLTETVRLQGKTRERRLSNETLDDSNTSDLSETEREYGNGDNEMMYRDSSQKSSSLSSPLPSNEPESPTKSIGGQRNNQLVISPTKEGFIDRRASLSKEDSEVSIPVQELLESHGLMTSEVYSSLNDESGENQRVTKQHATVEVRMTSKLHASAPSLDSKSISRSSSFESLASDYTSDMVSDGEEAKPLDRRSSLGKQVSASTIESNISTDSKEERRAKIREELFELQAEAKKKMMERRGSTEAPRRRSLEFQGSSRRLSIEFQQTSSQRSLLVQRGVRRTLSSDSFSRSTIQRGMSYNSSNRPLASYDASAPPARRTRAQRRSSLSNMGPLESARSDITAKHVPSGQSLSDMSASLMRQEIRASIVASAQEEIQSQKPALERRSSTSSMEMAGLRSRPRHQMPKLDSYAQNTASIDSVSSHSSPGSTLDGSTKGSTGKTPSKNKVMGGLKTFMKRRSSKPDINSS